MRSRTYGLVPNLRRVLILVDGISDDRRLLQKGMYLTNGIRTGLRQLAQAERSCRNPQSIYFPLPLSAKNSIIIPLEQQARSPEGKTQATKKKELSGYERGEEQSLLACAVRVGQ